MTSALGVALPLYTDPFFFASIVHVTVSLASLLTWSSKMPFVCSAPSQHGASGGVGPSDPLAFLIRACFSASVYFEKAACSEAMSSEACGGAVSGFARTCTAGGDD